MGGGGRGCGEGGEARGWSGEGEIHDKGLGVDRPNERGGIEGWGEGGGPGGFDTCHR